MQADNDRAFRVLLRAEIIAGAEPDFERTWQEVGRIITDQPANLGQWLMRSNDEPSVYYIISDWVNEKQFRAFEHSDAHVEHRCKLQPYRSAGSMITTQVVAAMPKAGAAQRPEA